MSTDDQRSDLHHNGVHVDCKPIPSGATWKNIGDGSWRKCKNAGKVERFHSHDFDGPLVCGCSDFAS